MPSFLRIAVILGLGVLSLGGCTFTYVQRAQTAYGDGRYLEVAEDLAAHEPELERLPRPHRVRYGMYRGLSLFKLGDLDGAHRWLRYAYDVEKGGQPTLQPRQRMVLDTGWSELQRALAEPHR